MVAHSRGESFEGLFDATGRPASEADRAAGARFELERTWPPVGPGSWQLALRTLARPHRYPPSALGAGWLPRGFMSTESLKNQIRRVVPEGWGPHPHLWIMACDYATGRRVAFGRPESPTATLADAVAASCAIPGFYYPVEIGGRRYVDGGMYSTSNLDVVRNEGLDLVICLNPTSSLHPTRAWNPAERVAHAIRGASGRRLGSEAKKLRALGTEVILIQPTAEDLAVMPRNLMSRANRNPVIETAQRTVAAQLREPANAELIAALPEGDPDMIRKPEGDPRSWPGLRDIAGRLRSRLRNAA